MFLLNIYTYLKQTCCSTISDVIFTYETVKVVKVPKTYIAVVYRILQLLIFAYIALYIVWYKKGYQEFQEPRGTSIIKIKGLARVNGTDASQRYVQATSGHLWDTAEYQIPPLENNAFFLATRQIYTYNQQEGRCASAIESDQNLECDNQTKTCKAGDISPSTFGFLTGNCVTSIQNSSKSVCEINGWCPEEMSKSVEYTLNSDDLQNFTIYLKTVVSFGLFNKTLRNVPDNVNFSCRYDREIAPQCPIIRVGTILDSLKTDRTALLLNGGVIELRQDWICDFDYDEKKCYPSLGFGVLQSGADKQSPGINYRYAQRYRENDTDYRTLTKVFGLRFVVAISGKGGQFNIVNLFVAIGSGIGFMVIAGIVCDAIFMYAHRARKLYRQSKYTICDVDNKQISSNEDFVN